MKTAASKISTLAFIQAAQAGAAHLVRVEAKARADGFLDDSGFFTQSDDDFMADIGGLDLSEAAADRFF